MRYVLVDNSTLSSVQRVLGHIPVRSKETIDGDIVAFDNLIQSILFYDDVFVIDDYKQQFRESRSSAFPFVKSIAIDQADYAAIVSATRTMTDKIIPKVSNGSFQDQDFEKFFDLLKMNVFFTWDLSSSEYFLTLKMVGDSGTVEADRFKTFASLIFSQLSGKSQSNLADQVRSAFEIIDSGKTVTKSHTIFDKDGKERTTGIGSATSVFLNSLSWISSRTTFYALVAKSLCVDLMLHPIRHSFHATMVQNYVLDDASMFRGLMDGLSGHAESTLEKIKGIQEPYIQMNRLPLFIAWIATKTDSPSNYIDCALKMRSQPDLARFRMLLIELEDVYSACGDVKFLTRANEIAAEVQKAMDSLLIKYGVKTQQGVPFSLVTSAWNIFAKTKNMPPLPNIPGSLPIPKSLLDKIVPTKQKTIYRALVEDLSHVSKLGALHEKISSKVVVEKNKPRFNLKTEDARFLRSSSGWKVPMK